LSLHRLEQLLLKQDQLVRRVAYETSHAIGDDREARRRRDFATSMMRPATARHGYAARPIVGAFIHSAECRRQKSNRRACLPMLLPGDASRRHNPRKSVELYFPAGYCAARLARPRHADQSSPVANRQRRRRTKAPPLPLGDCGADGRRDFKLEIDVVAC
jgi:hypothetical protein